MRETALIMRDFSSSYQPPLPHLNQIQFLIRISIHSTRKKQDLNLYLLISFQVGELDSKIELLID